METPRSEFMSLLYSITYSHLIFKKLKTKLDICNFSKLFPQLSRQPNRLIQSVYKITYQSMLYGDGLIDIFDKLATELLRLWRSANGGTEPYAILRHFASPVSPSPLLSLTSTTLPPTSASSESSADGGRRTDTRRVLPRDHEIERRPIGGLRPW